MVERLPAWLESFRKQDRKIADRWWEVERLYYLLS